MKVFEGNIQVCCGNIHVFVELFKYVGIWGNYLSIWGNYSSTVPLFEGNIQVFGGIM